MRPRYFAPVLGLSLDIDIDGDLGVSPACGDQQPMLFMFLFYIHTKVSKILDSPSDPAACSMFANQC